MRVCVVVKRVFSLWFVCFCALACLLCFVCVVLGDARGEVGCARGVVISG